MPSHRIRLSHHAADILTITIVTVAGVLTATAILVISGRMAGVVMMAKTLYSGG